MRAGSNRTLYTKALLGTANAIFFWFGLFWGEVGFMLPRRAALVQSVPGTPAPSARDGKQLKRRVHTFFFPFRLQ